MLNPFRLIEKLVYSIREAFWQYPELLFGQGDSFFSHLSKIYRAGLPYSHFISGLILFLFILLTFFSGISLGLLASNDDKMIEAIVMGVDADGRVQRINKVNPIIPSNIQLEKDLVDLIYEPLVEYNFELNSDGVWEPVVKEILAEEVIKIRQGADYQFKLRKGVRWHDGSEFDADDVMATLNLFSSLNVSNAYTQATKQLIWEKIDKYNIRICTKSTEENVTRCDDSTRNPIFSNFLELISIKILPEKNITDINSQNINSTEPKIFRAPNGTGMYKFASTSSDAITLKANSIYHDINFEPKIKTIEFKFYKTFNLAVEALQNGEVHSLAAVSTENLRDLEQYQNIIPDKSSVISNQYWAIYFNLRKDPNGKTIAPQFLSDVNVRKAIAYGIDKNKIIENALGGIGEVAVNTIDQRSEFFNPYSLLETNRESDIINVLNQKSWKYDPKLSFDENIQAANNIIKNELKDLDTDNIWLTYNPSVAKKLLDTAGWTIKNNEEYRTDKSGNIMQFSLYFVDSYDRQNIATTIQENLKSIGIKVITDRREQPGQDTSFSAPSGWSLNELNNQILSPRLFDVILYGVDTFIDPNRYELFHSSEQAHPGLNISGYASTEESVKPRENRKEGEDALVRLPKVDKRLEDARRFDPVSAKTERKENYDDVQRLIIDDSPLVFLYHPQFIYYHNSRLQNVDLSKSSSVEQRFKTINTWLLN